MGDHISGSFFQDVHLIVERARRGAMEFSTSQNNTQINSAISTVMPQNIPTSGRTTSLPYFESLNVFKAWDHDVSTFTNGDLGIQIRCPACLLTSNTILFTYTLNDGTVIKLTAKDVEAFGTVEYKERFFRPKINSIFSGNVLLLIIADNKNLKNYSNGFSCCCC
ncbi:hypothetical protein GINT2_000301 [Glugoides intestinalis]